MDVTNGDVVEEDLLTVMETTTTTTTETKSIDQSSSSSSSFEMDGDCEMMGNRAEPGLSTDSVVMMIEKSQGAFDSVANPTINEDEDANEEEASMPCETISKPNESKSIQDLPLSILEFILMNLSPYKDLGECRLVCKSWNEAAKSEFDF